MSQSEIEERRLSLDDVVDLRIPTEVRVVRVDDGSEVERITLLRFAGTYGKTPGFAIRNASGKFSVRGPIQLGLSSDSPFALIA